MIRSATSRIGAVPVLLAVVVVNAAVRIGERRNDDGQATAEYALVLLGAAAIAMAIVSWVSKANPIGGLFDLVVGGLRGKVK